MRVQVTYDFSESVRWSRQTVGFSPPSLQSAEKKKNTVIILVSGQNCIIRCAAFAEVFFFVLGLNKESTSVPHRCDS